MRFTKQDINKALETITAPGEGKSLVENNNVKNIIVFGDEVIVDVVISNPSLQAKKKVEVEIMKAIHDKVHQKIDVKVKYRKIKIHNAKLKAIILISNSLFAKLKKND